MTPEQIHLAQTGDCRLYTAFPQWELGFRRLSCDHNGDHPGEIERLRPLLQSRAFRLEPEPSGFGLPPPTPGKPDGLWRREGLTYVGGLEPTRNFGNWEYQPAVIHAPECLTIELSTFAPGELFALCSDGGNKFVEAAFKHFHGATQTVPLSEVADFVRPMLSQARDDVTIVFFRQVPS